jgi:hypothetical protein
MLPLDRTILWTFVKIGNKDEIETNINALEAQIETNVFAR